LRAQRLEYLLLEPVIDFAQDGAADFILATGKGVIQTAFAQPGGSGHATQAGTFVAIGTKDFCQHWQQGGALRVSFTGVAHYSPSSLRPG